MPSIEPSPRPWRITHPGEIEDANGNLLYNLRDCIGGGVDEANAKLIVDAVNERAKFEEARMEFPDFRPVIIAAGQRDAAIAERDRLRDLVRRLADSLQGIIDAADGKGEGVLDEALLREARAAIGEDAR